LQQLAHASKASKHTKDEEVVAVPKIVHHIYKYDISSGPWPNTIWEQSFLAWKKWFPEPEYRHIFWSDQKTAEFVNTQCAKFSSAFENESRDIVKSDFSRYCILWRLGGIYADLDYMPLKNFYADLKPGMVSLIQSPYHSETFQNSLMASPPHMKYWEKLMDLARFTMKASNVLLAAGPQLLEILPLTRNASLINTLPCNEFQRATHLAEAERTSAVRKGCKLLRPQDADDVEIKGIHWGTVSYSPLGTSQADMPVGLVDTWANFWQKQTTNIDGAMPAASWKEDKQDKEWKQKLDSIRQEADMMLDVPTPTDQDKAQQGFFGDFMKWLASGVEDPLGSSADS
jgi:hypothetical protein